MKKTKKTLKLSKETLAILTEEKVLMAHGGMGPTCSCNVGDCLP